MTVELLRLTAAASGNAKVQELIKLAENPSASISVIVAKVAEVAALPKKDINKGTLAAVLKGFADRWVKHQMPGMDPGK
jgi:hypothetical protein